MNKSATLQIAMGTENPRILVVDDSRAQRLMLAARLRSWGYVVVEAADGVEALQRLDADPISMVLSDWLMPNMSGPELCQALRERQGEAYTYFILLTSKQEKDDVSAGLTAGADDFLSKPVDESELRARLQAGRRLLDMQDQLIAKNAEITAAYSKLKTLYEDIDRDLRAASLLQQEFVPPPVARLNGSTLATHYCPAGHVGGDLVGYFAIDETGIGLYGIDVSGHGVSSCLLTIRLAQYFNPHDLDANIAFRRDPSGQLIARSPRDVVADLNDSFLSGDAHDLYFTIAYATLDLRSGVGRLCLAGHGHPAIQRHDGSVEFVGEPGPPVGLLPGVDFDEDEITLDVGERLFLYSDGLTEAQDPDGAMVEEKGFAEIIENCTDTPIEGLLSRIVEGVQVKVSHRPYDDDISILALERGQIDNGAG